MCVIVQTDYATLDTLIRQNKIFLKPQTIGEEAAWKKQESNAIPSARPFHFGCMVWLEENE